MRLGFLNADGFWKAIGSGIFYKIITDSDILCIAETWIKSNANIKVPGYNFIGKATHTKKRYGQTTGGGG